MEYVIERPLNNNDIIFAGDWDNSELKRLTMMENVEFEEKADIEDLVLPSKPMKMADVEINDIKQEPLEANDAFQSDHDEGKEFRLKMEETILELFEELEEENLEN